MIYAGDPSWRPIPFEAVSSQLQRFCRLVVHRQRSSCLLALHVASWLHPSTFRGPATIVMRLSRPRSPPSSLSLPVSVLRCLCGPWFRLSVRALLSLAWSAAFFERLEQLRHYLAALSDMCAPGDELHSLDAQGGTDDLVEKVSQFSAHAAQLPEDCSASACGHV